jgi:23S rRNA (guanine745-N1)-methyltransferase
MTSLLSGSVAAALSVFAPRNPRELHRVVASAGAVVVVSPGTSHLAELRAAAGEAGGVTVLDVHEGKQERTAGLMEAAGFVTSEETAVEGVMALRLEDVRDLVGMGPSAFHQSQVGLYKLNSIDLEHESAWFQPLNLKCVFLV